MIHISQPEVQVAARLGMSQKAGGSAVLCCPSFTPFPKVASCSNPLEPVYQVSDWDIKQLCLPEGICPQVLSNAFYSAQ